MTLQDTLKLEGEQAIHHPLLQAARHKGAPVADESKPLADPHPDFAYRHESSPDGTVVRLYWKPKSAKGPQLNELRPDEAEKPESETPDTDALLERAAFHDELEDWARRLERERDEARRQWSIHQDRLAEAQELIAEIMRDEVNIADECEKWLRAYCPDKLIADAKAHAGQSCTRSEEP